MKRFHSIVFIFYKKKTHTLQKCFSLHSTKHHLLLENDTVELCVTFKKQNKKKNMLQQSQRGTFSFLLATALWGDVEGETHFAEMMIAKMCDAVFVLQHFTAQK